MKNRGTFLNFLIVAFILASVGIGEAHQPGTISMEILKSSDSGSLSFLPDWKGKGDTKLQYIVRNEDPDVDVLLVFPACSVEGGVQDRMPAFKIDDLGDVLSGRKAAPRGPGEQRDPIWQLCQLTKSAISGAYLLKRGAYLKLQMGLDFRDPTAMLAPEDPDADSFKIAVHSQFDIYAIHPNEADSLTEALLEGRKPKIGVLGSFLKRAKARGSDARQWFSLFYEVSGQPAVSPKGRFVRSTYADLFLPSSLKESPEKGSGPAMREVRAASDLLFAFEDYQTPKLVIPSNGLEYDSQHSDIYRIPVDSYGPEGDQFCYDPGRPDCVKYPSLCALERQGKAKAARAATYNVTGRFSVKRTDHALHPGWGWRAVAWWNDDGDWKKLASEWVLGDGSYNLSINYSGYSGQHLRMQFRAYNRYYEPQDQGNNLYRWKNPDRYGISTSHDEGHWYADADGGDANGIGEMYYGAYRLWSKSYHTGGFNPIRPDPVTIYTPNTWYDCTLPLNVGSGGSPWSCASNSGSGQIWLTSAHSLVEDVVQHELAHNVNNEFWNNKNPAGSGGSHTICGRFNEGLALTEGYANFMPAWIQCNRGDGSCNSSNRLIESQGCSSTSRDEREWWVSMAFWDLHDTNSDGADILWYNHPGAVHSLYFQNGPANSGDALGITDFQSVYRNNCSAGHAGFIDDIFDQNVN
jgi:hypothetical protein